MSQEKIEQALALLEQAKKLLQNNPGGNIEKSKGYLLETIRCLKESR